MILLWPRLLWSRLGGLYPLPYIWIGSCLVTGTEKSVDPQIPFSAGRSYRTHIDKAMELNENIARLPPHLMQYVLDQDYSQYTAIDQAVWRHVMAKNLRYLPQVAHESYVEGLRITGISLDRIPSMYGMNRILKEIGWAAVAVDGLIPTSAFLEFQAYKVLVIAQDIRQLEHIAYTPAPDIIHESAGHAPIIANPEYAEYLRRLGEIGCRAISSASDHALFEAMRTLAILKEAYGTPPSAIEEAQARVDQLQAQQGSQSEMSRLKNLHWWTVEYGLIGTLNDPKIYGAGLLSSIGESMSCLQSHVKKILYTVDAAEISFDVTRPQPQLFVTPDFAHLSFVLEEFAGEMAIRKGGAKGVEQLIDSGQVGSISLNTGIQVSGLFSSMIRDKNGRVIYIRTEGPTALSYHEKELIGHGIGAYPQGFGTPIGKLQNINIPIESMSPTDLEAYKIREGKFTVLKFEGGIEVAGEVITGIRSIMGTIILISFKNCTVSYQGETLFGPASGVYHMAVGGEITSAFAGPADVYSFPVLRRSQEAVGPSPSKTSERLKLEAMYAEVALMREQEALNVHRLAEITSCLTQDYPEDFVLKEEIEELSNHV